MSKEQDSSYRKIKVDCLTRVEGEGALYVKIRDQQLLDVKLKIFEPPRFFEGFLRERSFEEAVDITARICGICPVAYQMSACHAIESCFSIHIPTHIKDLRRLLYCGEWIESHLLHMIFLHSPDFLRVPDALTLAKDHKEIVSKALEAKKLGNRIVALLGGREIHPINVKVGGFYKLPPTKDMKALLKDLETFTPQLISLLRWISNFKYPEVAFDYDFVSLKNDYEYPFNEGQVASSKGKNISVDQFLNHFKEHHVEYSTALHATRVGGDAYLTGPLARYFHNYDKLPDFVKQHAEKLGLAQSCVNPFRSIQIRMLEVIFAFHEAQRILQTYNERLDAHVEVNKIAGLAYGATEAPRGILFHHYQLDDDGKILKAAIIPPTSQNQKRIEQDLRGVIETNINKPQAELTHLCEQTIRNYDPCISCSTHFLTLHVDRQ